MTLTRWWLAGVMALTLGVGVSNGQCGPQRPTATPHSGPVAIGVPDGGTVCSGVCLPAAGAPPAARAPYYNEVADILFPPSAPTPEVGCSNSNAWQGVFDAM